MNILANVVERTRTIYVTISHVDLVPCEVVFSQTCAVVVVFKENVGRVKATIFLAFWLLKDRENPAVGAKNPGRWSR